jgi:hypothetical protein
VQVVGRFVVVTYGAGILIKGQVLRAGQAEGMSTLR